MDWWEFRDLFPQQRLIYGDRRYWDRGDRFASRLCVFAPAFSRKKYFLLYVYRGDDDPATRELCSAGCVDE